MKYLFSLKYILLITYIFASTPNVFAAAVTLSAPEKVLANRSPVVVQVFIDPQGDVLSGISGSFSFPVDLFTLGPISVKNSAVSLWVKQPSLAEEKYIDMRTHINFEGIFPGGYSGVRSPYYVGVKPGILFSVTLIPKSKGEGVFMVDDLAINSFTSDAKPLPVTTAIKRITVPDLLEAKQQVETLPQEVSSKKVVTLITRDPLINRNAWYLIINEQEGVSAIDYIEVAETDTATLSSDSALWRRIGNPYVLFYQDRSRYVHTKIVYTNNTYAITTVPPVENSHAIGKISRILFSISVLLVLFYLYALHFFTYTKKK